MPHSIVGSGKINQNRSGLITILKSVLDVIGQFNYLVGGTTSMSESTLFFRQLSLANRIHSKILYGTHSSDIVL